MNLMDPRQSLRDACKHAILLEEHLRSPERRCPDCISKHSLALEGYLEEARSLAGGDQLVHPAMVQAARDLLDAWRAGADPTQVAARLRLLRKEMVSVCMGGPVSNPRRAGAGTASMLLPVALLVGLFMFAT